MVAFHFDWVLEARRRGHLFGALTGETTPAFWGFTPEETYAIVWWSRNYQAFMENADRFKGFNMVFNMTILGCDPDTNQKRMPDVDVQLKQAHALIERYGVENFNWRFSPIPRLAVRADLYRHFTHIADRLSTLGVKECYAAWMHENKLVQDGRSPEERTEITERLAELAGERGMKLLVCWDDKKYIGAVGNVGEANCVNGPRLAEQFGLEAPSGEKQCGCALTINFGSAKELPCKMGCRYCVPGETAILMADYSWKRIDEIVVGDKVIGFDEHAPGKRKNRKFRIAEVTETMSRLADYRTLHVGGRELGITDEHPVLSGSQWKAAGSLGFGSKVAVAGLPQAALEETPLYKAGYLYGAFKGDGTIGHYISKDSKRQSKFRIAVNDPEILDRCAAYAEEFALSLNRVTVNVGNGTGNRYVMQALMNNTFIGVSAIGDFLDSLNGNRDPEFLRGFLAGIFDTEGSYSDIICISQRPGPVWDTLKAALDWFGFRIGPVQKGGANGDVLSARISGGTNEAIRFFGLVRPAVSRKLANIERKSLMGQQPVEAIDGYKHGRVYNIETTTHTYIANGVCVHNCYATNFYLKGKENVS